LNKKSTREILLIINDAFQFLAGILFFLAAVVIIIQYGVVSILYPLGVISLAIILFECIPLFLLGILLFLPGWFGILRYKAKNEKKQRFLILNIIGSFIGTILSFAGSFGLEHLIDMLSNVKRYSLTIFDIIILLIPVIMLILNILLLVFTIYIEIPTITDQNDEWKDY
jgi:hypothetical protein